MLPTKQYFHISALIPASKLHPIMKLLGRSSAYNVECRAYDPGEENKVKVGQKRDLEEVKQKIINMLAKGPMNGTDIADAVGEDHQRGRALLTRMVAAKLIKKGTKKGMYRS